MKARRTQDKAKSTKDVRRGVVRKGFKSTSMKSSFTNQTDIKGSSARKADIVDKHVGSRIRERRREIQISQQDMSEILGVSYQQLQKYENGSNRVSAGRLYLMAHVLKVDVGFFYQGLPPGEELFKGKVGELDFVIPEINSLPPTSLRQALTDLVQAIKESEKKDPTDNIQ